MAKVLKTLMYLADKNHCLPNLQILTLNFYLYHLLKIELNIRPRKLFSFKSKLN